MIFLFEYNNKATIGDMTLGDKILNSIFQSVTLRTAGFAAIDQGGLHETSVLVSIVLMIIGGWGLFLLGELISPILPSCRP